MQPSTQMFDQHPTTRGRSTASSAKLIAATVSGNALEFYDFLVYAFFAVYIGETFFPASTPLASLLLSLAVFGVGFVARPLGGLLIGAYADRAGRKPAMLLTIMLITIGTLGLAVTPSYQSIGIAAPIIVIICRVLQGFALGGEVGPSTAFLIEIAPAGKRGLYGGWQLASQGLAALIAGLLGMLVSSLLAPEALRVWGWRLPFAFGLLLIPVAVYMRRSMPETMHVSVEQKEAPTPVSLRGYSRIIVLAVLMLTGGTVATYVGTYMTTYAITTLHFSPTVSLSATAVFGASIFVFALLGGWLSDVFGRRPVVIIPRLLSALLTYPAFLFLNAYPSTASLLGVAAFLAALTGISGAASIAAIPELIPRPVRALGLSIAYALAVSIFGGTTQFVVAWLIGITGDPTSPAWYVVFFSVVTSIAMYLMPEGRHQESV